MSLPSDSLVENAKGPFEGTDDAVKVIFQWFDLARLETLPIYPTFLKEGLRNPPEHVQHVVHRDPNSAHTTKRD
jgi:hypothetical protein